MSFNNTIVQGILLQIQTALDQIKAWNADILSVNDYTGTQEGMKTLAATSMLLESIGEGVCNSYVSRLINLLELKP